MSYRFQQPEQDGGDLGPPPGPFRFRPQRRPRIPGGATRWLLAGALLIIVFIIANVAKDLYADWLWFDSIGYRSVYRLRLVTRVWLFFAGGGVFLAFFSANLLLALRLASRNFSAEDLTFGATPPASVRRIAMLVGIAIVLFTAVIFGTQAAGQWDTILLLQNSKSFGIDDPLFNQDIGFYVFRLPALKFIVAWSLALVILTVIAVGGIYIARTLAGGFEGAARAVRAHVSLLLVLTVGLFIWRYWLTRYDLVFSERGAAFGAAYTDVNAQLPVTYVLMALAAITAVAIVVSAFRPRLLYLPVGATIVWVVAGIAGGLIYPAAIQRFDVEPNELAKERKYIARNLEATRFAYGLDEIEEQPYPARNSVSAQEIESNPDTIQNIRLWDHRPLLQTLEQIQTIRPLYTFLNVDVDRYEIDGTQRQVMLAARELDPERLPADAQGWVNERLQYTHGFGITMIPVNEVVEEGLPAFFVKDIPPTGDIPVEQPRIYYGEESDHYVIVNTSEDEFDYASGDDEQQRNRFDGDGGVELSSIVRRFVYAWEFADTNMLISGALNSDSRLLYRRNIRTRVSEVAPFLRLDNDPYLVVADGNLYWMQDAYTVTDSYPYSTRTGGINYVRNSVKIATNAYDGEMTFYLVDESDPIVQAYNDIYPDLFTPFSQMPESLRSHLRYPEDLFRMQSQLYLRYHIRDADVFFNREDAWTIPNEVTGASQQLPVDPYYVIMRLPGEEEEEFVLFTPFSPARRNNTIAWLAARADGDNYGKLIAYRFPTEELVFGPSQVESRIDQDTTVSAQISLWNQSGSSVIRGNLLMIPIGQGNLFVEPLYLQATSGSLPELKRVVVANGNNIAMEPTLGRALEVVLGRANPTTPTTGDLTPGATPGTPPTTGTPPPTSTPQPTSELPDDVDALIDDANASFERAQQLLRDGDFAGYGEEIERLEDILQRLSELTGQ
jgi:uncharacterized membrane protein (UPF0182 family)